MPSVSPRPQLGWRERFCELQQACQTIGATEAAPGAGAREVARLDRALEDGVTGALTSGESVTAWATPMDWTDKDSGNSKWSVATTKRA